MHIWDAAIPGPQLRMPTVSVFSKHTDTCRVIDAVRASACFLGLHVRWRLPHLDRPLLQTVAGSAPAPPPPSQGRPVLGVWD